MPNHIDVEVLNEEFFSQLEDPVLQKNAVDGANEYTRMEARENGIWRQVIPIQQTSNSELVPDIEDDGNQIILEKEPSSPVAMSMPYNQTPRNWYIKAPRFRVTFHRVASRRFQKDIGQLRSYKMDIRQILSDNAMKDILAEEDRVAFEAVDDLLGPPDSVVSFSNVVQYETMYGGISRDTIEESFKIMHRTPSHFEVAKIVLNHSTYREFLKWGYDEVGGEAAGKMLREQKVEDRYMNVDWIVTIKRHLVPDNAIYHFATPECLGVYRYLEDVTMSVERKAYMIQWFLYEEIGGAISNSNSVTRADFV